MPADSLSDKTGMSFRGLLLIWYHPGKEDLEQSSEVKWEFFFKFPLNTFLFKTFPHLSLGVISWVVTESCVPIGTQTWNLQLYLVKQ